jgi:hypothetical protein
MLVPVSGRLRFSSAGMAHAAALHGLGIAIMPEFACAEDLRRERLVSVLDDWVVEVGAVWLVHPSARHLTARVRTFVDLALERLARQPPWVVGGPAGKEPETGAARSRGERKGRGKPGRGSRRARGSRA